MKVLFILGLILAVSFAFSVTHNEDKNVEFVADPNPDSPLSIMMKGVFNRDDQSESDVTAFLRLAEELIPVASSKLQDIKDGKTGGLTLTEYWCNAPIGSAFRICLYGYVELYVGWRVYPEGTGNTFNLTYVPFAYLRAGGNASASSYPAEVGYGLYFSITEIEVPLNFLIGSSQVCYAARFDKFPTALYTVVNANLLECWRSIPDRTDWACKRVEGSGFRHLEYAFDAGLTIDLLPYTCINF